MAMLWQCCGEVVAVLWQCCGEVVAVLWQCYNVMVAMLWQCCGEVVAVLWRGCGSVVARLWHVVVRNISVSILSLDHLTIHYYHDYPPPFLKRTEPQGRLSSV